MAPEANMWVAGKWYGPSYPDAGDLPADDAGDPGPGPVGATPPPQAGAGSSRSKWAEYASTLGVDVDDDAARDDIIAAVSAAGHPVD